MPPNFWTCIIKYTQIPIRWQSFRAIGRGRSENGSIARHVKHHKVLYCRLQKICRQRLKTFPRITTRHRPCNQRKICTLLSNKYKSLPVYNIMYISATKSHIQSSTTRFARIIWIEWKCPYKPTSRDPILLFDSLIISWTNKLSVSRMWILQPLYWISGVRTTFSYCIFTPRALRS